MTVNKKTTIGNYIFLAGIFILFMLNLNVYEWYVSMSHVNYVIAAILMTVLFICKYDFIIVNDDLEQCIIDVDNTLQSAKNLSFVNNEFIASLKKGFDEVLSER